MSMSSGSVIDEKVVSMRFDNAQFESGVKESMSTLDKLKSYLTKLPELGSSLGKIGANAGDVGLHTISESIDSITDRFKLMGLVGLNVLNSIAQNVVRTGEQMVRSLTIAPITDGWQEYNLKMDSVQTIMAGTGESLDRVMSKLNELNDYADKTIYSFSDMTQNIGKFTNAGVSLDAAVGAIQGVANVAAVSGANTQQASHAMYNFAQALSTGYIQLIDWKSIRVASMDTIEFKNQLIQTAEALGTLSANADGTYNVLTKGNGNKVFKDTMNASKNFENSLSSQWLTTEVLTQTLNNYSTDLSEMTEVEKEAYREKLKSIGYSEEQIKKIEEISEKAFKAATEVRTFKQLMDTLKESVGSGWAESFEYIYGNFDESKALWTSINEELGGILQKSTDARNELLKGWKSFGGRDDLIGAFWSVFHSVEKVADTIKTGFNDIFPPMTAKRLAELTKGLREFLEALTPTEKSLEKFRKIVQGVFSAFDIFRKIAIGVGGELKRIYDGYLSEVVNKVVDFTVDIAEWVKKVNSMISAGDSLSDMLSTLYNELGDIIRKSSPFGAAVMSFVDSIAAFSASESYMNGGKGFTGVLRVIFDAFSAATNGVIGFIEAITGSNLSNFKDSFISSIEGIRDSVVGIFDELKRKFNKMTDLSGSKFGGFTLTIIDLFSKATKSVLTFIESVTGLDLSKLKAAITKSIMGLEIKLFGFFNDLNKSNGLMDKIQANLNLISEGLGDKFASLFDNINLDGLTKFGKVVYTVLSGLFYLITSVGGSIIEGFKAIFNNLGNSDISNLNSVTELIMLILSGRFISNLYDVSDFLDNINDVLENYKLQGFASIFLQIAAALVVLGIALAIISSVDPEKLANSVGTVTLFIFELCKAVQSLAAISTGVKGAIGLGTSLILISVAVLILAGALKKVAEIDVDVMAASVGAITGLFLDLVGAAKLLPSGVKGLIQTSIALILFSFAVKNISGALANISDIPQDALTTASVAIAGVMGALTTIAKVLDGNILDSKVGMSLLLMSAGVMLIAKAIKNIAEAASNPETLWQAVGVIAIIILGLGLFSKYLDGVDLAGVGTGLLLISVAIFIIAKAVVDIASVDSAAIILSLVTIGGALAVIGMFSSMIDPKNLTEIGFGIILVAASFFIIAKAITSIGQLDPASLGFGMVAFALSMLVMVLAIKQLSDTDALKGAASMLILAIGIKVLGSALKTISGLSWGDLAKGLVTVVGALVVLGGAALLLETVAVPMLIIAGALALLGVAVFTVGTGVLALASGLALLAGSGLAGLGALVTVLGTIIAMIPQFINAILVGILSSIEILLQHMDKILELFIALLYTLCEALKANLPSITESFIELLIALGQQIVLHTPELVAIIVEFALALIQGFIQGLADGIPGIVEAGTNLIINLMEAFTASKLLIVNKAFEVMIEFINGLAEAIEVNTPLLEAAIERLFNAVVNAATTLLGSGSTIGEFIDAGKNLIGGIIDGIKSKIEDVKDAIKSVGDAIKKKWNDFWDIHSPSKVAKEMAGYVGDGLVEGFESKEGEVADASEGLGETASSSMGGALSKIKDALDFDIMNDSDLEPVITPVVDLSNIKSSSKEINSMLDNPTYTANATTSISTNNADSVKQQNTLAGMHLQIVEMNKMLVNIMKSINDIEIPETNVDVELSPNAKALFKVNQKESTNYRKRTGRPAYQTM